MLRMNRFLTFAIFTLVCLFLSCSKEKETGSETLKTVMYRAEVIAFHAEKCACCWGWDIRIGNDTIRTADTKVEDVAGYTITDPVPVRVVLGAKDQGCSDIASFPDHYSIVSIEKIN
jgi:hypothetical protein